MSRESSSESEGIELANDLEALFKSDGFSSLLKSTTPENIQSSEEKAPINNQNEHIENFVACFSPDGARETDRRTAAEVVRKAFEVWKSGRIEHLKRHLKPVDEVNEVEQLTLKTVSTYSKKQFEHYKREAATLTPGSLEQIEARKQSDRWSIFEEIITPAADED